MDRRLCFPLLLLALLLAGGCGQDRAVAPGSDPLLTDSSPDPELAAAEIMRLAGWPLAAGEGAAEATAKTAGIIVSLDRQEVAPGIAHYAMKVRVGRDPHDVIGVHRVVKEIRPGLPIHTCRAVFLQHGDVKDFAGMFLPGVSSPRIADDFGLAVTLAQADIDVWGIDQAWTLVPAEETDFSFMAAWGLDRQVRDLGVALEIGRVIRRLTGDRYLPMPLLGYSSGAVTGFALLNAETQLPAESRKVSGFIAGDYGMLSDDPVWREALGAERQALLDAYEAGVYELTSPFPWFGQAALSAPDEPSELIPGLTNLQAAIGLGIWPGYPNTTYHFLGGVYDADDLPSGLQYTNQDMWIDFLLCGPPFESARFIIDYESLLVPELDAPWDDHLGQVTIPILYIAAVGGAGEYASHTLDLLGSTDITRLDIGFHPPEEVLLEFGHIDLMIANDAPALVYAPIRDWIEARTGPGPRTAENFNLD